MSVLRVSLFGKFHAQLGEQVLASLNTRKVQELFCYLLLYRGRSHPREALASLLWPDSPTPQSRKCLRQAVWRLQTALDPQTEPLNGPFLLADPDWIQLNLEADLWLDVAVFEQAFALIQKRPGQELNGHEVHIVQKALKLYRGDLLKGWYQDWCLFERERLQQMYLAMLEKQMAYCEAHGEYEAGLDYGIRALRCDVAHERIHRRLMRLHYLAGNRTAALRQYERCTAFLRQELDVAPSARTTALYEQICSDRFLSPGEILPESDGTSLGKASPVLPQVLFHLKQLQTAFTEAQYQLQEAIQTLAVVLHDQD